MLNRMAATADGPARTGVTAQLSVCCGREAVEFYRAAFGAREVYRVGGTDEHPSVVSQLAVGDTTFWVSDESPEHGHHSPESLGGATVRLLLIAGDPAAVIERAAGLGGRWSHPPRRCTAGCWAGSTIRSAIPGRSAGRWAPGRLPDQAGAAAAGDEAERPAHQHEQPVLEADQVEEVDAARRPRRGSRSGGRP